MTRFSGRPAPPREGPAFMQEAYSHEVISHGFWPGNGPLLDAGAVSRFCAHGSRRGSRTRASAPTPPITIASLASSSCRTRSGAHVGVAGAGDSKLVDSTYNAAAALARWDRAAVERPRRPTPPLMAGFPLRFDGERVCSP